MDSHAERFLYKVFCHLRTSNARIFVETVAAIVDKATKRSGLTPLESGLVYDLTAIDSRNDFFLNTEPLLRNWLNDKKLINVSLPLHQAVVFYPTKAEVQHQSHAGWQYQTRKEGFHVKYST